MANSKIVQDILNVVTGFEFDPSDFDPEFAKEIQRNVRNWVKDNKVKNVEYTVSKEEIEDYLNDCESLKKLTNYHINFLNEYSDVQDTADNVFGADYEGPGWDGHQRSDDRWNDTYFFTGSDCTYYTLVKKI